MAAPFVSHDGEDAQGVRAEVWVQTGTGTITTIERKDDASSKNAMVVVKSSLAQVKKPIKGWIDKSDPVYAEVLAAHESGREVEYRLESQRKKAVDRTTPIAELRVNTEVAGENTMMIFAGLDGTLTKEAVTNPAEDPTPGGRNRATDPKPAATAPAPVGPVFDKDAALAALATARATGMDETVIGAAAALALMAGATAKQVTEAGFTGQRATGRGEVRRAFAAEAPPHVAANSDQRVNLGSYQVQAAFAAERFAYGLLEDAAKALFDNHNAAIAAGEIEGEPMEAPGEVRPSQALSLAKILLELADHVQVGAYGGGRPDRMANSHTRSRALIFDAVRTRHPVPFGAEPEVREAWRTAVIDECVERFRALAAASQEVAAITATQPEAAPEQTSEASTDGAPEQPAATVTPVTAARSANRPKVRVEGDEGFEAPSADVIKRFGALASAAGYEARPNSPVQVYLMAKFGVNLARKVNGEDLEKLIAWFEAKGPQAGDTFRQFVERDVAAQQQSA